jgi:hypothetical protein
MGIILDYARERIDEATREASEFLRAPLKYIQEKQPIRRAVLLDWSDIIRPNIGTKWEHKLAEYRGKPLVERPGILK